MDSPSCTEVDAPQADSPDSRSTRVVRADLRTKELFSNAKVSLDALSAVFESLHVQTLESIQGTGPAKETDKLRHELNKQEQRHIDGLDEIQRIIDELLENKVAERMRHEVEKEINAHLDDIVASCVAECLQARIPEELQAEVEESKRELERARLALYNSESRRMNGKLRFNKTDGGAVLETLMMPNGRISAHFPKNLGAMFELDARTCRILVREYGFPNVADTDSRDKNLNRFMQFCGVGYQLVPSQA